MNTSSRRSKLPDSPAERRKRIQLPRSSTRLQMPNVYLKIVESVRTYYWGGIYYDGSLHRPGAVVERDSLPCPLVAIECAGPLGEFRRGKKRDVLYIVWQYDDETEAWHELARALAQNWSWTVEVKETVLAALHPRPELVDVIQRSRDLAEALVTAIDERLACERPDIKASALFSIYEAVAGRLATCE